MRDAEKPNERRETHMFRRSLAGKSSSRSLWRVLGPTDPLRCRAQLMYLGFERYLCVAILEGREGSVEGRRRPDLRALSDLSASV